MPKLLATDQVAYDTPAAAGGNLRLGAADKVSFDDEQPQIGTLGAAWRGFKQGATFGFADELSGAMDYVMGRGYMATRDRERALDAAAREQHGFAYGAGDIAGNVATSFVPGLGIAKGASLGATALKAGAMSALSGLGSSEKEDLGGQLADAAKSGVLGAATAGIVGKVFRGAPERVEKRLIGDITDGATATQRDKVVGRAGAKVNEVVEAIRGDKAIKAAGNDPNRLLPAIEDSIDTTGQRLDGFYPDQATIKVSDVLGKIEGISQRLAKDPGKLDLARAVEGKAMDVLETWGNQTHVTPQQVRVLAKDVGDAAFRGSPAVAPKQGTMVSREVWGELKDLISDNVEHTLGKDALTDMKALNQRMSTLLAMREAVAYRATRGATTPTTLTSRLGGALDVGLAFTDPTTFAAKKAYDFVGKPAVRKADEGLAALANAARNGSTSAQLTQMGLELGFGRATGELLANWAAKKFGGVGVQPAGEEQPAP